MELEVFKKRNTANGLDGQEIVVDHDNPSPAGHKTYKKRRKIFLNALMGNMGVLPILEQRYRLIYRKIDDINIYIKNY